MIVVRMASNGDRTLLALAKVCRTPRTVASHLDQHDLQALGGVVEPRRRVQVPDECHQAGDVARQAGRVELVQRRQKALDAVHVLDRVGRLVGCLRDLAVQLLPALCRVAAPVNLIARVFQI